MEDPDAVAAVHGSMPVGGAGTSHGAAGAGTRSGTGLAGALGNEDADLEAAIAASLGEGACVATGGAAPSGADDTMDDVAVVDARLGGAGDGLDMAEPDAAAAEPVGAALVQNALSLFA